MRSIGIDGGVSGAIAVIDNGQVCIYDMPVLKVTKNGKPRSEYDEHEIFRMFTNASGFIGPPNNGAWDRSCRVTIETIQKMPKFSKSRTAGGGSQGHSGHADFGLGTCLGLFRMLFASTYIRAAWVNPRTWKSNLGLKGGKENKGDSLRLAKRLYPQAAGLLSRVKDHGRAEALLIAHYGATAAAWADFSKSMPIEAKTRKDFILPNS